MKKIVLFATTLLMAATASAQKVSSTTYVKERSHTQWYVRLGMSINNAAGAGDILDAIKTDEDCEDVSAGSKVGMALDFGFQKNIGKSGLYWGMELGIGSRGASMTEKFPADDEYPAGKNKGHFSSWNVKYSPFTFGYKYALTDDIKLDGHIGAFVSYDFSGKTKFSWGDGDEEELSFSEIKDKYDFQCFDAGMQIGIGVWWKKFNLDFTYQRGFVPAATVYTKSYEGTGYYYDMVENELKSSNFMIRLGYAF